MPDPPQSSNWTEDAGAAAAVPSGDLLFAVGIIFACLAASTSQRNPPNSKDGDNYEILLWCDMRFADTLPVL